VFLRQWGEQFLPKEHLDRRKSGFGVPVAQWLRGPKLDGIVQALVRNRFIRTWFKAEGILVAGLSPTCRSGREHRALVPHAMRDMAPSLRRAARLYSHCGREPKRLDRGLSVATGNRICDSALPRARRASHKRWQAEHAQISVGTALDLVWQCGLLQHLFG
jgi:hypothetical protein